MFEQVKLRQEEHANNAGNNQTRDILKTSQDYSASILYDCIFHVHSLATPCGEISKYTIKWARKYINMISKTKDRKGISITYPNVDQLVDVGTF